MNSEWSEKLGRFVIIPPKNEQLEGIIDMIENQEQLPPDIAKAVDEHFGELL